jgi:hypothetical protein
MQKGLRGAHMKEKCPHLIGIKCGHPQSLSSLGEPEWLCATVKQLRQRPCLGGENLKEE